MNFIKPIIISALCASFIKHALLELLRLSAYHNTCSETFQFTMTIIIELTIIALYVAFISYCFGYFSLSLPAPPTQAQGNSTSTIINNNGDNNKTDVETEARQDLTASASVAAGTGGQKLETSAPTPRPVVSTPSKPGNKLPSSGKVLDALKGAPGIAKEGMNIAKDLKNLFSENKPAKPTTAQMFKGNHEVPLIQYSAIKVMNGENIRATIDGVDHAMNLSDHAATELMPTAEDFGIEDDEMTHQYFRTRQAFLKKSTYTYSNSAGDLLGTIPMTPFQTIRTAQRNSALYLTPLEYLSMLYYWWRGSIDLVIQVIAPREVSGRIAICLGYDVYTAPLYANAIRGPTIFFDFDAENREIKINIPYVNGKSEWMSNPLRGTTLQGKCYNKDGIGNVYIFAASKLAGNTSTYAIPPEINYFISGGPDFRVKTCMPPASVHFAPKSGTPVLAAAPSTEAQMLSANTGHSSTPTRGQITARKTRRYGAPTPDSLAGFAAKWDIISTVTITPSTSNIAAFNFPSDLLTTQSKYSALASTYFTGDLVLRIKPVAAGWVGGQIIVGFIPFEIAANAGSIPAAQLTHSHYVTLDMSSDSSVEMVVPFLSQETYWYNGCPNSGAIFIKMLNGLQVPAAGVASQDIAIEAAWINFKTYIPRQLTSTFAPATQAQAADTAAETTDEAPQTSGERIKEPAMKVVDAPYVHVMHEGSFQIDQHRMATMARFQCNKAVLTELTIPNQFAGLSHYLKPLFSSFCGSMLYTIIVDSNNPDLAVTICKKTSGTEAAFVTANLETPNPGTINTFDPGFPNANSYVTLSQGSGRKIILKCRLHTETSLRYVRTITNGNVASNAPLGMGALKLLYYNGAVSIDAPDGTIYVLAAPSEHARFAHFRGIPAIYLYPAYQLDGTTAVQYYGEYSP